MDDEDDYDETFTDNDRINCPWCGKVAATDLWEQESEWSDTECASCGKAICITRVESITYWASKIRNG